MRKELRMLAVALLAFCGVSAMATNTQPLMVDDTGILPFPLAEDWQEAGFAVPLKKVDTASAPQTRADEAGWTSLGNATYREDIFASLFNGVDNSVYEVEIQENNDVPGYYRLVNPYGPVFPYTQYTTWDSSQNWYLEIHAENPNAVYIEKQNTGAAWMSYGNVYVHSYAASYLENGNSLEDIAAAGWCGTLANGVITFPTRTLLALLPDYSGTTVYPANRNGMFAVALPGADLPDYSFQFECAPTVFGKGQTAGISTQLTMGKSLTAVHLAVVPERDANAAVALVTGGTVDVLAATSSGTYVAPFSVTTPTSDYYTLVAVGYAGSEVKGVAAAPVLYLSATDTWTDKYVGTYTFSLLWKTSSGDPWVAPWYGLFQSSENAALWKIEYWGGEYTNFVFTWDRETNEVLVADQSTGYSHPTYGEVFVDDLMDFYGHTQYGGPSYYDPETGLFHLGLVYYAKAGVFGRGEETFEITVDLTTDVDAIVTGTWSVSGADRTLRIAGTDAEAVVYDVAGHVVYRGTDRAINVPAAGVYMVRIGAETKRAIIR